METIMTKFRSHAVRFPTASFFRPLLQLTPLDVEQVAAQQHQVSLTEYYDILLAHEPPPPSEPTNNPALNVSLHRLNRALQAALQSIGGDVPEETPSTPEGADASAEAESLHQPPATEPQPQQTNVSDQLDTDSGVIQSPQLLTATDEHSEPEPEPEPEPSTQSSPLGPTLSPTNAVSAVDTTATSTATCEDDDSAGATASTTEPPLSSPVEPKPDPDPAPEPEQGPEPDPEPEPEPDVEPPAPEVDWAEARELEIARLGSENARLRALLGIDPASLTAAGIPDIDPEPPSMATLFLHHAAQSSSAWANGGAESSNPFTAGFREDPSVLGLAATPSRLHTLTPPNAPHHATDAAAGDTTARAGALANRASGVFVSASWGPFAAAAAAAAAGNGNGNGNGGGNGVGVGLPGQGPMAAQIQQQQKPQPPLGIPGLGRTELQGPGGGPGAGRGRGVLFGGRGRSVGW
jgi:hypothetical protein